METGPELPPSYVWDRREYAGAWRRVAGRVIDRILVMLVASAGVWLGAVHALGSLGVVAGWTIAEAALVAAFGQTPACALLGMRIEAAGGGAAGLGRAIRRSGFWVVLAVAAVAAGIAVPQLLMPCMAAVLATDIAGLVMVASRDDKRHVIDLVADTAVVRVPARVPLVSVGLFAVLAAPVAWATDAVAPVWFETSRMASAPMRPTLEVLDRFLSLRYARGEYTPRRGDVVLYTRNAPLDYGGQLPGRIVGIAGDTLAVHDGALFRGGVCVEEPYVREPMTYVWPGPEGGGEPLTVPNGHVLILGDNRNEANDGHMFGPIPQEDVIARALIVYWPLDHAKRLEVTE